jgi:hypothetical protein
VVLPGIVDEDLFRASVEAVEPGRFSREDMVFRRLNPPDYCGKEFTIINKSY